MQRGIVKWFDSKKGYGHIRKEDGSDIFVHHTGINMEGFRCLYEGLTVEFEIMDVERGRQAINVTVVTEDEVIEL